MKKNNKTYSIVYYCQRKRKINCNFCITFKIETIENEEIAFLSPEKTHLSHNHLKKHKVFELDAEQMRRSFKGIEKEFYRILAKNNASSPKGIFKSFLEEGHFNEKMLKLNQKYHGKFKKSVDNQTNKFKRKLKKQNLVLSLTTIKNDEASYESSFFSEATSEIMNFLKEEENISNSDETKEILVLKEEEDDDGSQIIIPPIFY